MSVAALPLRERCARRSYRWLLLAAALALPVFSASCKKDEPPPPAKAVALDPVPAPAGLLAEFFVPNPDVAWGKARASVAGPAMFLPATVSTLAATMLGLPLTAATEIDGQVPVVGALVERPGGGRPLVVLGVHVRSGEKLVDLLTKGESARLKSRLDASTNITVLEPKEGGERPIAIGVLGNYLLVSQSGADLVEVGPYVARTLPSAKMPTDDATVELPRSALGGPIAKSLRASWESLRPKPRAAEAGSTGVTPPPVPNPLNGLMETLLEIVGELDHATVKLNFDEKAARMLLVGVPIEGGKGASHVASMSVADPRRLLDLPADSEIAVFLHDAKTTRVSDAKQYTKTFVASLGKDVPEDDRAAIEGALIQVAEGRGDGFVAGVTLLSTGPAAYVRSEVADAEVLGKGLDSLLGLTRLPSVEAWLGGTHVAVTSGKTALENVPGEVRRIRLERLEDDATGAKDKKDKPKGKDKGKDKPEKKDPAKVDPALGPPQSIDVLYMLGKDGLVLAAGYEAKAALRSVLDSPSQANLAGRADVKAALLAVGPNVSFVAFVDPLRLIARRAGKSDPGAGGPVVFSLGKGGAGRGEGEPWMRLDIANPAIQELLKHRAAL